MSHAIASADAELTVSLMFHYYSDKKYMKRVITDTFFNNIYTIIRDTFTYKKQNTLNVKLFTHNHNIWPFGNTYNRKFRL